jgi:hypothetical protein
MPYAAQILFERSIVEKKVASAERIEAGDRKEEATKSASQ